MSVVIGAVVCHVAFAPTVLLCVFLMGGQQNSRNATTVLVCNMLCCRQEQMVMCMCGWQGGPDQLFVRSCMCSCCTRLFACVLVARLCALCIIHLGAWFKGQSVVTGYRCSATLQGCVPGVDGWVGVLGLVL